MFGPAYLLVIFLLQQLAVQDLHELAGATAEVPEAPSGDEVVRPRDGSAASDALRNGWTLR